MNRSFVSATLAAPALAAMGCNTILGIDKTYRETDAFSGAVASAGSGGAGGGTGAAGGAGGDGGGHALQPLWMKRFGDSGDQGKISAVAVTAEGEIVVVGCFKNKIDFGGPPLVSAGDYDLFLVKLDESGNHVWSKRFGNAADNCGHNLIDIDIDGNIVLAGGYQGTVDFGGGALQSDGLADAFIAKLDPTGAYVWSHRFGDANYQTMHDVAIDPDGNIFVAGAFSGTINLGGPTFTGADNVFLARFDAAGTHVWSKTFATFGQNIGAAIDVDTLGDIVLLVQTSGKIDLGGGELPMMGMVAAGVSVGIAKYTPDGTHVWSNLFGGTGDTVGKSLTLGPDDSIYFGGRLFGTTDFGGGAVSTSQGAFFAKLGAGGEHAFSIAAPNVGETLGFAADSQGNLVAGGWQWDPWYTDLGGGALEKPAILAKLDPNLKHLWSVAFGEGNPKAGDMAAITGAAIDSGGNVVVVGAFNASIIFGADTLMSAGGNDVFIAKFPP